MFIPVDSQVHKTSIGAKFLYLWIVRFVRDFHRSQLMMNPSLIYTHLYILTQPQITDDCLQIKL